MVLVAVLGLLPGRNVFIAPDGRWLGEYIPAAFRGYPFTLGQTPEGQEILCVDEDSGLITDGPQGEIFFGDDGEPASDLVNIHNFLRQMERNRAATQAACVCLQEHAMLQPLPLTLNTPSGDRAISGLLRINEAALSNLSGNILKELQQTGALMLAYCQLLSISRLPVLGRMTGGRQGMFGLRHRSQILQQI